MPLDPTLAAEDFCYLTTTGRVSGNPHTIEIWFGVEGDTVYMLAGGGERADWIRNARKTPRVQVRIRDRHFGGVARAPRDSAEDALARRLLVEKYQPRYRGSLTGWGRS